VQGTACKMVFRRAPKHGRPGNEFSATVLRQDITAATASVSYRKPSSWAAPATILTLGGLTSPDNDANLSIPAKCLQQQIYIYIYIYIYMHTNTLKNTTWNGSDLSQCPTRKTEQKCMNASQEDISPARCGVGITFEGEVCYTLTFLGSF
jgi:hypothetical protein